MGLVVRGQEIGSKETNAELDNRMNLIETTDCKERSDFRVYRISMQTSLEP